MGVTSALPRSRPLTYDDLEHLPDDDGHRYELVDGTLIVTPSPSWLHQRAAMRLLVLLNEHCPSELEVFPAALDVVFSPDTVLEPDVLVVRRSDLGRRVVEGVPVLAVEVLSPSTRRIDLGTKRLVFEARGVPSYWVVDPDEPSLTVFELEGSSYVEVTRVTGDEAWSAARPYPVTVVPAALVT
jgi:Uma2 family endonuclease